MEGCWWPVKRQVDGAQVIEDCGAHGVEWLRLAGGEKHRPVCARHAVIARRDGWNVVWHPGQLAAF